MAAVVTEQLPSWVHRSVPREFDCGCRDSLTFKTACMTGPMDRNDSGLFICEQCPHREVAQAESDAQRESDKGGMWEGWRSPWGGPLRD